MRRPTGANITVLTFAAPGALVALASGVGLLGRGQLAAPDFAMLYLLGISVAAWRFGRASALLASTLSVLAYHFFFVPPFHTFAVTDARNLLTFATMFVVGLATSTLTLRSQRHEQERARLADRTRAAELKADTEQMRSSLLSAVSHDLRTPLGAITGAATTLRELGADLAPEQRADLVDAICKEADRLEHFVVNLLEMTRVDAGALTVKREWVPLEELVGSALTRLEPRLTGRPVKVSLSPELPLLSVDPVLFEQVLFNLLENASVHTPPETEIEITAFVREAVGVLRIRDHGEGISPGLEQRIFEKFFRANLQGVRGAGLGLPICRGIVAAHGGTLEAWSDPAGGAVFSVELPLVGEPPLIPHEAGSEG